MAHKEPKFRVTAYTTTSALPHDPFYYDTDTPLSVVLSSYGKALNPERVNRLIAYANNDARSHDQDSLIQGGKIVYLDFVDTPAMSSNITLGIIPVGMLTWGQWEVMTRALILFFQTWDIVELQFEIGWAEGITRIGWGRLVEAL